MAERKWQFGQTVAADYVPPVVDTDAVWVRTFKTGTTQIRIAPCEGVRENGEAVYGADAWPTQREHYDPDLKLSYGCINDLGSNECVGCASNVERTKKRSRYWYVNAFDKDNELRVYKFGKKVHDTLLSRQQRLTTADNKQPLSDRDILVTRMGQDFNDITYDVDWGEKYPVDFPEELHDIPEVLGAAFDEAMERYAEGEVAKAAPKPPAPKTSTRPTGSGTVKQVDKSTTSATNAKEASELTEDGHLGEIPSEDQLMDADTGELKRWLKDVAKVDFPATAPRSRLIKIAKETLAIPF